MKIMDTFSVIKFIIDIHQEQKVLLMEINLRIEEQLNI